MKLYLFFLLHAYHYVLVTKVKLCNKLHRKAKDINLTLSIQF